jgi:hypothetical protein
MQNELNNSLEVAQQTEALREVAPGVDKEAYDRLVKSALSSGNFVDDATKRAMGRRYFLPEPVEVEGRKCWIPFRPAECY